MEFFNGKKKKKNLSMLGLNSIRNNNTINLKLPFFVSWGRLESNIEGASVANLGGKSSIPGKSEFKK